MIGEFLVNQFDMSVSMVKAFILMVKLMPEESMMGLGMFCGLFLWEPMYKILNKLNNSKKENDDGD